MNKGTGLLVGGWIATGVGTPIFISGLVFLGICPSCTYIHVPLLLVGGAHLAAGIPMVVAGSKRRAAYQKALREHELGPVVSRTRDGSWCGGLRFRF
jgi:hypothetical protein